MRLNTTGIAARMMLSAGQKSNRRKTHQRSSDKPDTSAGPLPPRGKRSSGDNERTISHIHR